MVKRMLIDALHAEETRVVIADENQVYDFDFVSTAKKQLKGNIYLAKITRVEPSLQAAFVEYGGGKQGFLPFSEIHPDYYQIPMADRQRLMEEAEKENLDTQASEAASETSGEQSTGNPESSDMHQDFQGQAMEGEQAHPAYLMEGAIDISISEEAPGMDDDKPFASALEPEASETQEQLPSHTDGEAQLNEQAAGEAPSTEETVETIPNEEEEFRAKKINFTKRYKIQEVIRRNQIVLVQVIKEERGNKGASLTTYLSLAGRYCVLMPNSPKDGGISRKISSGEDRKRLKAISTELRLARGMSVIIRTAGMDRTRAEIKRDYDYLVKLWNRIREDTLSSTAPALIYEESDIIKRAIRDQYTSDIDEVVIEGDTAYKSAKDFMKLLLPSHTPKIKHYKEATPLFYGYNIEEQLLSMHDPVVKLKSGGYIVINPTEALISIDVNSGRATGERNIEETATKTNLETAVEVARQLRLRDLAGLIVIDFIDMMEPRNRRAVEKALKDALKADRAKIQLGRISPFGLLEMSRQRLRPSISETNMVQCPHCVGRGFIRSNESMSIQAIRAIEKEAASGNVSALRLIAPQQLALYLLNHKRDLLRAIEQRYNISVQVLINPDITTSEFNLEKIRRSQQDRDRDRGRERTRERDRERLRERDRELERESLEVSPEEAEAEGEPNVLDNEAGAGNNDQGNRRRGRRGRRGRGRDRDRGDRNMQAQPGDNVEVAPSEGTEPNMPAYNEGDATETAQGGRPPRQRGGRGRRRWRDRDGEDRKPQESADNVIRPDVWQQNETPPAASLPAFATQAPVLAEAPPPPPPPAAAAAALPPTPPRDPSVPAKKGWWQKIIELDD